MRTRTLAGFVAAALILVAGACASSGGVAGERYDVTFVIDNNLPNITGVSTYVVTQTGSRRSLGPVESNEKGNFERSLPGGTYTLVATRVSNPDIVSERFQVDADSVVVSWNLAANQVTFGKK